MNNQEPDNNKIEAAQFLKELINNSYVLIFFKQSSASCHFAVSAELSPKTLLLFHTETIDLNTYTYYLMLQLHF